MGAPVKYETAEEMQVLIDGYFTEIDAHNKDAILKGFTTLIKPYTITGLALALDMSRKGLIEYSEKNETFGNTIRKAKGKVERFNEEQLYRNTQVTGIIFNLKNNFKWRDQQDLNHGGQDGDNPVQANLTVTFVKPKE